MASTDDIQQHQERGFVSERALRALKPALSYGAAFGKALARQWTPEDQGGNFLCCIAENKLTVDLLYNKMCEVQREVPAKTWSYPAGFRGTQEAREAVAHVMKRTFMQGVDVRAADVALLTGAGACLEVLFHTLASPGEGVLLPSPIYPAFINDMEVRSGLEPILFPLHEEENEQQQQHANSNGAGGGGRRSVQDQLSDAAARAEAEGHPIRIMLLTNPNNPLGIVYKRETIREILKWCLAHKVHLLSDEIYAWSTWGEGGPDFVSTEVLARQEVAEGAISPTQAELLPLLLHTVWGLSKDMCASGLRVGVVHTRNHAVMQVVDNLSYFHTVAGPQMWTLSQVLKDDAFVDTFLAENRKRMREAYNGLSSALTQAGIPHVHATAAMFCWVDLRAGLLQPGWEGERELWRALTDVGVLLTPGEACKADAPGFFRICWAWVPAAALPCMAERIAKLLAERTKRA